MNKEIKSIQNPLIKELLQLKLKARARKKTGMFLIEGQREISLAIEGGYKIQTLLIDPSIISADDLTTITGLIDSSCESIQISNEIFRKLAQRESTEGLIAVCKSKKHNLGSLNTLPQNPLVLVAESIEKPGNIGALLRTADAAGADLILIANPLTDIYNPNIIRSSVGCVFTTTIATGSSEEIIDYLKNNNITILTASLEASLSYDEVDYKQGTALIVGSEASGLSSIWNEASNQPIIIPMQGKIDSMNVSVSAAILIFEAVRQRKTT